MMVRSPPRKRCSLFLEKEIDIKTKREMLYKEVRYAKLSSENMPTLSALFRLQSEGSI